MVVLRVLNHRELEAEINSEVGDFVKIGDVIGLVTSVHQEEPEYIRYMGDLEKEEVRKFLPDVFKGRRISRCLLLCTTELKEVTNVPKVGDKVERVEDEELRMIHYNGELRIPYLIPLLGRVELSIIKALILKIMQIVPEEKDLLEIILAEIEYSRMKGVEM